MTASALVKAACEGKAWLMGKETWPGLMTLSSHLLAELPGIEWAVETLLTSGNLGFQVRESHAKVPDRPSDGRAVAEGGRQGPANREDVDRAVHPGCGCILAGSSVWSRSSSLPSPEPPSW